MSTARTFLFITIATLIFLPTLAFAADDPCTQATEKLSAFERSEESERYSLDLRHSNDESTIDQAKQQESRMMQSFIPSYAGEVKHSQPEADEAQEDLERVQASQSKLQQQRRELERAKDEACSKLTN